MTGNGALSPREREVADLIRRGYHNTQIARALGIRPNTARTHVQNILAKTGAHSRAEVAASTAEVAQLRNLVDAHHGGTLGVRLVEGRCPVCVLAEIDPERREVIRALLGGDA